MLSVFPSSLSLPSPLSFHPPPCAGMKHPHLEIPSLLKAGSTRQRASSGKLPHYAVTRATRRGSGGGGLGGAEGMHGIEPLPTCVAAGPRALLAPWLSGSGQGCLLEPGQLRMLL